MKSKAVTKVRESEPKTNQSNVDILSQGVDILLVLKETKYATAHDIKAQVMPDRSIRTAQRYLRGLVKIGLAHTKGQDREGLRYFLSEKSKKLFGLDEVVGAQEQKRIFQDWFAQQSFHFDLVRIYGDRLFDCDVVDGVATYRTAAVQISWETWQHQYWSYASITQATMRGDHVVQD